MTFDIATLEQIIKQYINLGSTTGTGWIPVLCKVCGDSGRKGARAGFKFDGSKVAYHCFNCSMATVYDPETHQGMPQKMVQVLNDFGVPEDQWKQVLFAGMQARDKGSKPFAESTASQAIINIEPMPVPLPSHFYALSEASPNDVWAEIAKDYLEHDRGVDPKSYPFYLAHKTDVPELDRWFGRIIIPIYKEKQLIFYTGRDLTGKKQKKYLSPSYTREKVIYGFSELFRQTDEPLYIVEGWFDAYAINGVAILGNEISNAQATWLNKSYRKKVYIPDRLGDGWVAAEDALSKGWSVSTPQIGNCKDINEAVIKYGRIYVMKSIAENIAEGFTAQANLGIYCKYDTTNKDRSKKKDRSASQAQRARK
jgi:hypothetical protein